MLTQEEKQAADATVASVLNAADETVKADLGSTEEPIPPRPVFNNVDLAAKHYTDNSVKIAMMLPRASKKEMQRLINALVAYPIDGYPKFKSGLENSIFDTFISSMEAKYYMISYGLEEKAKKNTEAEEALNKEAQASTKEENVNG